MPKRKAFINKNICVACGCCLKVCPKNAIEIFKGIYAQTHDDKCVGCGLCAKSCPADAIELTKN